MGYLLGIDCGATSTEVVLHTPVSAAGKQKAGKDGFFKFGDINYNLLGLEKTVHRLVSIIKKTTGRNGLANTDYIIAGISGARHEKDKAQIKLKLQKALKFRNIEIYPDTIIAFAAAFEPGKKNCGVLIAGTGSVLYYLNNKGKMIRVGGWGRYIGDEGSGYWIARTALHALTQYYDGRAGKTSLAGKLDKVLNVHSDNIIKEVYHNHFEISKVTKLVFDCAESGDKVCKQIIREAAENLSSHFIPLKNAASEIALCGSLFSEEKLLEGYLRELSKEKFPGIKLVKPRHRSVWGAVKIGIGLSKK